MSDHNEWMSKHKGRYLRTVGMVWQCYDECGCTQPLVIDYFQNKVVPAARVPVTVWEGTFRTEFEDGADAELAAYRRELAAADPEREASIVWQEGIDYDA